MEGEHSALSWTGGGKGGKERIGHMLQAVVKLYSHVCIWARLYIAED